MTPKTLTVFIDARNASLLRLEIAVNFAREWKAHLVVVFVELSPVAHSANVSSETYARGSAIDGLLDTYLSEERSGVQLHQKYLENSVHSHELSFEWHILPLHAQLQDVTAYAKYADLSILGIPASVHATDRPFAWSSTDIVLSSGVPSLLVPDGYSTNKIGTHAVIGWNASREARRAVSDAMPLLKVAKEVTLLIVNPKIDILHPEKELGSDIAGYLARHGVSATICCIDSSGRDAATALVEQAKAINADLLVAGAYGHSRVSEFILGSATHTIVTKSQMPILFSH